MQDNDILFVQVVNRKIVIHETGATRIGSLTQQLEYLLSKFGFEKSDSNKFVQMDKITWRDKRNKKVYFDKERTRYCPVTRPNMKKFFW